MDSAKRRGWLPGFVLVAAVLIAFGPAWHAGFIWDDDAYVTQNPLLTAPDGLRRIWFSLASPSQYFPLTYTSFYFERKLWGLNPAGYHIVNLFIHAANAVLVWRVLTRLAIPGAWLAAAIFALHPVQVESVAWVTERKNLLMGFFFLLAAGEWLSFIDNVSRERWRHYLLALVFYGLSLSAKTTACTLPAALLLMLWLKKTPIDWKRLAQVVPFLAMGIGMGLVTVWWERFHQGTQGKLFEMGWLDRVLLANRALWFYIGKLFWPANLTFSYARWTISASDWVWVAGTVGLAAAIWRIRRWAGRGVETAMLFYAATLAPMLGFIMLYTFVYSFVADHYQYIACIGPIALAAAGMEPRLRQWKWPVGVILLTILGLLTWRQSATYANAETLWRATIEHNPTSWLARNNLGMSLMEQGDLDDAMDQFQKSLAINPDLPEEHLNAGVVFAQKGQVDKAMAEYRRALALDPHLPKARVNLAGILMDRGQLDEAIGHLRIALAVQPWVTGGHKTLGVALAKKGQWREAIAEFQKALQAEPGSDELYKNLGLACEKANDAPLAIPALQKALEINPDNIDAADSLAWILSTSTNASLRNGADARALAQHALELAGPDNPFILRTLAAAEAELGNYQEAAATARKALENAVKQKQAELRVKIEADLKFYQAGKPARD